MSENEKSQIWKFYRDRTALFFIVLVLLVLLVSAALVGIAEELQSGFLKSFVNVVVLSALSGTIASAFFSVFTKTFMEKDYNDILKAEILSTLSGGISEHSKHAVEAIKLKLKHLQKFIPDEPYTNRLVANDIVEQVATQLTLSARGYCSFGITGKYAALRLREASDGKKIRPADVKVFVVHPLKVQPPLIFDVEKTKLELLGSLGILFDLMQNEARLNIELVFVPPLPTLRFDLSEEAALIYLYEDFGSDQSQLPDVALYHNSSHWYEVARSVIREFDQQAMYRIRSTDLHTCEDWDAEMQKHLAQLSIDREELEAAKLVFHREFVVPMKERTRSVP